MRLAGLTHSLTGTWIEQMVRGLTDFEDGFLRHRYLIMDRDPLFTVEVRSFLDASGLTPVRLRARSPNLNAYAERFVLSVRAECLSHVIPLGERHLRGVRSEFLVHYNHECDHQGLRGEIPVARPPTVGGRVVRRSRLGGLLNFYERDAA